MIINGARKLFCFLENLEGRFEYMPMYGCGLNEFLIKVLLFYQPVYSYFFSMEWIKSESQKQI